jgi:hypothetical protein
MVPNASRQKQSPILEAHKCLIKRAMPLWLDAFGYLQLRNSGLTRAQVDAAVEALVADGQARLKPDVMGVLVCKPRSAAAAKEN